MVPQLMFRGFYAWIAQGPFKRAVTKYVVEEKSKLEEQKSGWYTETAMAAVLKMSPPRPYLCCCLAAPGPWLVDWLPY